METDQTTVGDVLPPAAGVGLSRRAALGLAAGGIGAAAGIGAVAARRSASGITNQRPVLEVALRGDTFRLFPAPTLLGEREGLDPTDFRGSPFWTEGWIYPEGTIQGDGFLPTIDGAIGHWFCRGNLISSVERSQPHIVSNQEFVLGLITADRVFPPDVLSTVGLEATDDGVQDVLRTVNGGSGKYRGATGQVLEIEIGLNATIQFGTGLQAPNFRFEFDIDTRA